VTPRTNTRILTNFRLPAELIKDIDRAASLAGLNRTEWVISTLTVATREGLRAAALAVAAGATGSKVGFGALEGCAHPKHRRAWRDEGLACLECGTLLHRKYRGA
jgi:hypothetical protein